MEHEETDQWEEALSEQMEKTVGRGVNLIVRFNPHTPMGYYTYVNPDTEMKESEDADV